MNLIFKFLRLGVRLSYSVPGRVRLLGRTLLGWSRLARIFYRGGMEAVNRRTWLKPDRSQSPFPPFLG